MQMIRGELVRVQNGAIVDPSKMRRSAQRKLGHTYAVVYTEPDSEDVRWVPRGPPGYFYTILYTVYCTLITQYQYLIQGGQLANYVIGHRVMYWLAR